VNARSALYIGSVMHRRFRPRIHRFRYKAFWLLMDLDELDVHPLPPKNLVTAVAAISKRTD